MKVCSGIPYRLQMKIWRILHWISSNIQKYYLCTMLIYILFTFGWTCIFFGLNTAFQQKRFQIYIHRHFFYFERNSSVHDETWTMDLQTRKQLKELSLYIRFLQVLDIRIEVPNMPESIGCWCSWTCFCREKKKREEKVESQNASETVTKCTGDFHFVSH